MFLGEIETNIGTLAVFCYRVKNMERLYRKIGDVKVSELSPSDFIRKLVSTMSYLAEDVVEFVEPKESLTEEQLNALTLEDLDAFSTLFLKEGHGDYFYRKIIHIKNEEDGTDTSDERDEIFATQKEGERSYEYLHRLFVLEAERNEEIYKKNFGSLGLSESLTSQFATSSILGLTLNKQITELFEPYRAASDALKSVIEPYSAVTDTLNRTLEPYRRISKSLEPYKKASDVLKGINIGVSTNAPFVQRHSDKILYSIPAGAAPDEDNDMGDHEEDEQQEDHEQRLIELTEAQTKQLSKQINVLHGMNLHMQNLNENQVKAATENTSHMAALVQVSQTTSTYMRSLNENQVQAAKESSLSSAKAERLATKGLHINWAVLVITFLGSCAALYSTYLAYQSTQSESAFRVENKQLKTELEQRNEQFELQNKRIADLEIALSNLQKEESAEKVE